MESTAGNLWIVFAQMKKISAWHMWMPLDNFLNFYEVTQLMFGQHVGLVQPKMKMISFSCHCELV